MPPIQLGLLYIVLSSIGFGLIPLFARLAAAAGIPTEVALLYRYVLPALIMLPWIRGGFQDLPTARAVFVRGVFMGVGSYSYFQALNLLPVATVVLVFFTYPLFTIFFSVIFYREPLTRRSFAAGFLILIAVVLIANPNQLTSHQVYALILSLLSPIAAAINILGFTYHCQRIPITARISWILLAESLTILCFVTWLTPVNLVPTSALGWVAVLGLACFTSLLPQLLLAAGAALVGSVITAVGGGLELVTALLIGWTVFSEPIRVTEVIGAMLVLLAFSLTVLPKQWLRG